MRGLLPAVLIAASTLASLPGTASAATITFNVVIEGAQETPPNASTGTGSGTAVVDTAAKTITLNIAFSGLTGAVTGAQLHGPAGRGAATAIKEPVGTTSPITDVVAYSPADEADILAGLWYMNMHTAANPGGEVRGQLDNVGRAAKTLTVLRLGNAASAGTVTSSPPGIGCGADCAESYAHDAVVTLTATAGPGETFDGWGGACLGAGTAAQCIVTMDALKVAQPVFTLRPEGDTDHDGIPNGVEPGEGRDPLVKDNDVFGNARLFAMQLYRDFLSREGDPAGITGWSDLVTAGTYSRSQVIDAFLQSQEFSGFVAPVVRLYFAAFQRVPDYEGLSFNAGLVKAGTITPTQLADYFTTSPEFAATYGSLDDTAFVTLLYGNVLGRAPDPAGLSGWVGLLGGGHTRGQVLIGFSESAEHQAGIANDVFVTMMYAGMLRRTPEPSGFSGWVGLLDASTYTRQQVIDGFFFSTEYFARFMQLLP